jgi:hypothetical protein
MADSKILMHEVVNNTERKFGEALEYFPVEVENKDGQTVWAMFTENEIKNAIERAEKNKEDIPKSLWEKIFG